jgi:hypothetical protein
MIHTALTKAGGVSYLVRQAAAYPTAFMALVGKIVPAQIDATIRRELPEMTREELLTLLGARPKGPAIEASEFPPPLTRAERYQPTY